MYVKYNLSTAPPGVETVEVKIQREEIVCGWESTVFTTYIVHKNKKIIIEKDDKSGFLPGDYRTGANFITYQYSGGVRTYYYEESIHEAYIVPDESQ